MTFVTRDRKPALFLLLHGLLTGAALTLPLPAAAAPTYEVGVNASTYLGTPESYDVISSTTPVSSSATSGSGYAYGYASGSAGAGYLGAYATTAAAGALGYAEARAGSNFILNDLVFSSLSPADTQVTTSLNFTLYGNIFGAHNAGSNMHSRGSVSIGWQLKSGGVTYLNATGGLSYWSSATDPGVTLVQADGFLADLTTMPPGYTWSYTSLFTLGTEQTFTLNNIALDLGRTYQLTAWIMSDAASGYSADNNGNTTLTVDFGSTMSFPASGAVFNLPEGFSVNSADGAIVNNLWIDPRPAAVVPIPAAVWLFGSGLLGLIGVARRKEAGQGRNERSELRRMICV